MRLLHQLVAVAAVSLLSPPSVVADDSKGWTDIKDPQELRALYSNKTHRSRNFIGYYRADGRGMLQSQGSDTRHPRVWALKGSDQICAGPVDSAPTCFRYQRNNKDPNEILAMGELLGQRVMLWFNVADGIPQF